MTSMLELVEASAGVYLLSNGPGMDLSPPDGIHSSPPFSRDLP